MLEQRDAPFVPLFPFSFGYRNSVKMIGFFLHEKDGAEETVLKTARATLRSRLLTRFVGDRYAVFVLTPVGRHVEAVEVREAIVSDRE